MRIGRDISFYSLMSMNSYELRLSTIFYFKFDKLFNYYGGYNSKGLVSSLAYLVVSDISTT